jgi:hypothetical protein
MILLMTFGMLLFIAAELLLSCEPQYHYKNLWSKV